MAQDVTLKVGGTLMTRYRYTSNEDPSNTFNIRTARISLSGKVIDDFGLDYHVSNNLIFSAVGTYINDRRLAPGHHNYFMFDLQMSLRF